MSDHVSFVDLTSSAVTGTIAGVIGHPVGHSLSPNLHNPWLAGAGIGGRYRAVDVPPEALASVIPAFRDLGLRGFNITVPHKTAIIPYLDALAPVARQMGAVNVVAFDATGKATGYNTDGTGFMAHLKASVPDWPVDRPALVIGAGGAARAAVVGLLGEPLPFVMITNRSRDKAEAIASEIGRGRVTVVDWADRHAAVGGAGLIANTTSLGMKGQPSLELDLAAAAADCVVYDIVYQPLMTDLLTRAEARGLRTVTGLGMLVEQARAAFRIWFGQLPDVPAGQVAELEARFR
ncbi:shikimate dehydrogenase [Pseudokordiimonas caeni]|uniref:shikimate dehydrogenase n=1 Tax=Pseudokordiimonas caeni TaxID=2997908 RepID=UPI0028125959|nr:shikimate dehydrogenase [Pseudokordiimonas caeni]